ncbi:early nodulin-like protein 17 [Zostera marina]|uniref:Early nodulin-like protein 17 n=1 Tax=Zostera marina TaxID=29655 RepID=A0A0K9PMG7_ZOSMR|nr:early nodulin-like protein 17 [Zostera marina]
MGSVTLVVAFAIVAYLTLLTAPTTAFNRYTVGGRNMWNPGVNYSLWNNDTHYYVGDWLVFLYQPNQADVVQVNKTDYEQCRADNPITNYSRGRSYAFRLNHTGDYYFICSKGYCFSGMKLHIHSEKVPPPPPPASADLKSSVVTIRRSVGRFFAIAAAITTAIFS